MFESDYEYRENRIKEKLKWLIAIILGIVFVIVVTKLLDSCSHRFVEDIMEEKKAESITKLSMNNEIEAQEVLKGIAIKNGDWTSYPLSTEFLKKYNSKDGIFPQYSFEEVSGGRLKEEYNEKLYQQGLDNLLDNDKLKNSSLGGVFSYRIGNGLTKLWENSVRVIIVTYYINNKGNLDDFIIISDKQTVDEYGDPVRDYDKEFTEKNIRLLTDLLYFDHWCWYYSMFPDRPIIRKEPISKRFAEILWKDKDDKNQGFIDFFDGLDYTVGNVYWLKNKTKKEAFNENDLYCICKLYKEGEEPYYDNEIDYDPIKNYLYKVDISLDKEKKLDDIKVRFIREITNEEMKEKYTARLVEEVNE